ncbi:TPA_asm: hypothetical protein GHP55_03780 [Listeria monocytogenes]|nr:hypothetical protein [Listeria monocytogenes]HBJ9169629.1 hypothetical protein [Listeria monocytogenes]HDU1042991.1 hypothetical protein [Listeria monocytogenes]HDU1046096.1 hypothetical protein [Listeria monocytogenes]
METIVESFKEDIISSQKNGVNYLELTRYRFENGFQANVLEGLNSDLVTLIEIDPNSTNRIFFFDLTSKELAEKLEAIKREGVQEWQ